MAADPAQPMPEKKRGRPKGSKNKQPSVASGKWIAKRKAKTTPEPSPKPPKDKSKGGKPPAVVDSERVRQLARDAMPIQHIATLLGISKDTLKKHCSKELDLGYSEAVERVNTMTWAAAQDNPSVLLHLRKVLMGEADRIEIAQPEAAVFRLSIVPAETA